ncbi:MAG: L-histidine N(alpha)-methyltransferase [Terriglobales bacterium]
MSTAEWLQPVVPDIAADVARGLAKTPKSLPPRLFYDAEGSRLFEEITRLPEYYLTRTEQEILHEHAREMVERAGRNLTVVELGAGTATKTAELLGALARRQLQLRFYPIDVCASALENARSRLRDQFPNVRVYPIPADFTVGLPEMRNGSGRKLVLFLGSSIGNFEHEDAVALLRKLRSWLARGDCLLLGADLVKSAALLLPAYMDRSGVTERFNKNLLARINRELGGNFDLRCFRHVARWNRQRYRMEMYLESRCEQTITIAALGMQVRFDRGERIHTENSYKYTPAVLASMLREGGWSSEHTWTDGRRWFAETLARAA